MIILRFSQLYPAESEADIKFYFKVLVIGDALNMASMHKLPECLGIATSKSSSSSCFFLRILLTHLCNPTCLREHQTPQQLEELYLFKISTWRNCICLKLSATQIPLFQFKDENTSFHTFWHLLQTSMHYAFFHSLKVTLKIFLTGAKFQQCWMDNK